MIHKIVKRAVQEMDKYDIKRDIEKAEMIYCLGRIESATDINNAETILKEHLQKHYNLYNKPPTMDIYQLELKW